MNRIIFLCAVTASFMAASLQATETLPLKSVNKANDIIDAALQAHGGAETVKRSLVRAATCVAMSCGSKKARRTLSGSCVEPS